MLQKTLTKRSKAMKAHQARHSNYKCVLTAYVSIFLWIGQVSAFRPVCDIPPADISEPTTLTCFFPEDFVQSKSGFRVVHLTRNISVINSIWEDGLRSFSMKEGFSMEGQNSEERLTFKIDNVSRKHTGVYACIPEGYKHEDVGTCTLHLKTERPKEPESLAERNIQDCTWPNYLYAVLFTAVIGVPVISLVIVLVLFMGIEKTQRRQRDKHGNANSRAAKVDEEKPFVIQQSENTPDRNHGRFLAIFGKLLELFSAR